MRDMLLCPGANCRTGANTRLRGQLSSAQAFTPASAITGPLSPSGKPAFPQRQVNPRCSLEI